MNVNADPARHLSRQEARTLHAGSAHYSAYVGPPREYDFMGATQFRLLTALGLRDTHRVLDFGCGSLRAGRLLIPYLLPSHYYGVEPNTWLIDDAIANEIGNDQVALKRPVFSKASDFTIEFDVKFRFILVQSVFSHAGRDLIQKALRSFKEHLDDQGLVLATFIHSHTMGFGDEYAGKGWVYPECVTYEPANIMHFIREAGMHGALLPWFHPRQQWYAMAGRGTALPPPEIYAHLSGGTLGFAGSLGKEAISR